MKSSQTLCDDHSGMFVSSARYSRRKVVVRWKSLIKYLDELRSLPIPRCVIHRPLWRPSPPPAAQLCSLQLPLLRYTTSVFYVVFSRFFCTVAWWWNGRASDKFICQINWCHCDLIAFQLVHSFIVLIKIATVNIAGVKFTRYKTWAKW